MDPKHIALLRIHDACRGLSHDQIEKISAEVKVERLQVGDTLFRPGQTLDSIYIVVEGRLSMKAHTPSGGQRLIRYLSAGDQFGAIMIFSDGDIPVEVTCDETAVLFRMTRESAERLMDQLPHFRRNLMRKIGFAVEDAMHWRRKRTVSKMLAFVHTDEQSRELVAEVASWLAKVGERIGVLCDSDFSLKEGSMVRFQSLRTTDGDYEDYEEIRSTIEGWPPLDRILLIVDRSCPQERLQRLVGLSDSVFWFSTADRFDDSISRLKQLSGEIASLNRKMHLVSVLAEDEQISPWSPELSELIRRDFKVRCDDSRMYAQGIDRLVHYLRDVSIGLALSGGAAHGMAHLGVLRAFEEAGITIDRIAGTSAGVLTGVLYCAGYTTQWGVDHFTHDLEPGRFFSFFPKGDGLYLLEKYRKGSWDRMLRNYLQDWRIEQLCIPVSTVTTDLVSAQAEERTSGDAVDAVLESINLPVLSPPICRDGKLLVDGGIVNNLPADLLVNHGCNLVVGVDVAAHIEQQVGSNLPDTPTEEMHTPGVAATLLRCLRVQAHNMSRVGADPADVIITPDVSGFEPTAFTKTPEMAEVGYRAAVDEMPRIRDILKKLDGDLFK